MISTTVNGSHVPGSPFEVTAGAGLDDTWPSRIKFNVEQVRFGVIGQEIKTVIDTSQAGLGIVTATCLGPSKPALCEFNSEPDGNYSLKIIPQETGKHVLNIKYNNQHIPNSPCQVRISDVPDASKVKVSGPGICHGILSEFESKFLCETKGAGAGQLTVRIKGPKGNCTIKTEFKLFFFSK